MDGKGTLSGMRTIARHAASEGSGLVAKATDCRIAFAGLALCGTGLAIVNRLFVVKPYRELSAGISRVIAGDFETCVDMPPIGPARKPIRKFNKMLGILSRAVSEREEYLYNVSHEFKTPLAHIQQFATLLQDDALSEEDREEYLAGIIAGTRRLSNMVSSMLELAIASNFDGLTDKESYALDEQLRQAVILFIPLMDQKELSYDADLAEMTIQANKCLLDEVWTNILSNAVKYTDNGGLIHVSLRAEGGCAKVAIADTGIGMSEEELERAFERFYRNEATVQEGTGLGLTIAKTIIDRHGGTLHLDSSPGKGTTCSVTLPLGS